MPPHPASPLVQDASFISAPVARALLLLGRACPHARLGTMPTTNAGWTVRGDWALGVGCSRCQAGHCCWPCCPCCCCSACIGPAAGCAKHAAACQLISPPIPPPPLTPYPLQLSSLVAELPHNDGLSLLAAEEGGSGDDEGEGGGGDDGVAAGTAGGSQQ